MKWVVFGLLVAILLSPLAIAYRIRSKSLRSTRKPSLPHQYAVPGGGRDGPVDIPTDAGDQWRSDRGLE